MDGKAPSSPLASPDRERSHESYLTNFLRAGGFTSGGKCNNLQLKGTAKFGDDALLEPSTRQENVWQLPETSEGDLPVFMLGE